MLVTSCSGAPGTVALPPRSQMLSKTLSPGPSWRSPTASSWERPAQCPDTSMPAPLTLPWHLTLHRCIWAPAGSRRPPHSPAARGLSRRGSPCSRPATHQRGPTGWVGAESWARSKLDGHLPEQSSHPRTGTARALSSPPSSCRHACCCPEASPPPRVPSQEGFSTDRHIHTLLAEAGT